MAKIKTKVRFADISSFPRGVVYKMCSRKVRYHGQSEATKTMRTRMRFGSGALHTYFCPICEGWHLAHDKENIHTELGVAG